MNAEQEKILKVLSSYNINARIQQQGEFGENSYIVNMGFQQHQPDPDIIKDIQSINQSAELNHYEKFQDHGEQPLDHYSIKVNCK